MTPIQIVFVSAIAVLALAIVFVYNNFFTKEVDRRRSMRNMAIDAMFIALIMVVGNVPNLGYIPIIPGVASATTLPFIIVLGASLMGWKHGAFYGLVFGITSYFQALSSGGFNLLFAYPWTAIPPRIIFGIVSGLFFELTKKFNKSVKKTAFLAVSSFGLTIVHTLLVFGTLFIFFPSETAFYLSLNGEATGVGYAFAAIIGIGMLGEAALSALLVPVLNVALRKALPNYWELSHR